MVETYIRHGFGSVRPYVYAAPDIYDLVEIFEGEVLESAETRCGIHIEAKIGDSIIVFELCDRSPGRDIPASIYVYVKDVDTTLRRAGKAGFTIIREAANTLYHERAGGIRDSFGNTWWVSTYTGEVEGAS